MKVFLMLFLIFIFYSFIGWLMETTVTSYEQKKFVDRGFLVGPYCPIYGVASIIMIYLLNRYNNDMASLFVMAVVICSLVEYLTSYFMEKLFKARWWDYSHMSFNINGRICLSNSICFGFLGVALIKFINPFVNNLFNSMPPALFYILTITLLTIFITDCIISFNVIAKLKFSVNSIRKDYTSEINEKVKQTINERSKFIVHLFNRLTKAFPDIKSFVEIKPKKKKSKE